MLRVKDGDVVVELVVVVSVADVVKEVCQPNEDAPKVTINDILICFCSSPLFVSLSLSRCFF